MGNTAIVHADVRIPGDRTAIVGQGRHEAAATVRWLCQQHLWYCNGRRTKRSIGSPRRLDDADPDREHILVRSWLTSAEVYLQTSVSVTRPTVQGQAMLWDFRA